MTNNEIEKVLYEILKDSIAVKVELVAQTALLRDGILDSMDFMNYLVAIEDRFSVRIPEEDVETHQLGIIGNMANYLHDRLKK